MRMRTVLLFGVLLMLVAGVTAVSAQPISSVTSSARTQPAVAFSAEPTFTSAVAFDVSPPLRDIAAAAALRGLLSGSPQDVIEVSPDRGPIVVDQGWSGDGALQSEALLSSQSASAFAIPSPIMTFEGISNADNLALYGFRVNPPDPVGDIGRNHYVEMVNLAYNVYNRQGKPLMHPVPIGDLWAGFPVEDCTDPSGDPIVIYDQFANRWLLTQFTTRFTDVPENDVFYNCVAISKTADPTGQFYRYAFTSGNFFPDYPKYGVWTNSYLLTSRDFGPTEADYGISVYALEKAKMLAGDPNARAVQFFLDSNVIPIYLIGDGLLPADIDGSRLPSASATAPFVGTMDNGGPYGAPFDGLNIWDLSIQWTTPPTASLVLADQLPVASFDSIFPCGIIDSPPPAPTARDCLAQPGVAPNQYLDILSYRQRPMWRLAYRNFGGYEAMVTNQSVEAAQRTAGVRWYEIRRTAGNYSVYQQGTYAPGDGIHRWMASIAMDKKGNMALGYSVVNGVDVYPGIRYTGRMAGDPLGVMPLGEAVLINGSGSQLTTNSRWGDYTSMNIDPRDDCTFWYVNEYYQITELVAWQTRIGTFKLPGC
jgi:hypothetical protein